ncbi:NAD(P)-binding protein [Metschnikowia bicuspidata var. bicuspidata NRRL YB-4993]|uniref:NAD(P)-binding protein n=1 Tax=Metschnikowia bicuspidata var. bicuspidata NRRL YB-4993 TaxID=869754 RepID=A0A1A0HEF6_9ASCO|nr:NAD(P)-binding protein [Metschnikowia bicuspidata var. bicuspidata NRRL YB-4993]OBA22376.1 NAD(P)-binding protein [Metschnikowia bicuspidata var. bicuspidata NRRL YB-4993]
MTVDETVFVTGATGFIGAHCVGLLLLQNYRVKAYCRSKEKFDRLARCVPETRRSFLEPAFGSDITNALELATLMAECTGVLHLASPFTFEVASFVDDLLLPALQGTKAVLKAALANASVNRVVITSSFAAVYDASKGDQPGVVLDETDFSPLTWQDGATTKNPAVAYRASKTVAENAAWKYMEQHKPNFSLTVLCPTMVFGPLFSPSLISGTQELNFSNQVVWGLLKGSGQVPPTKNPVWVDVRDLAEYHVKALSAPNAANQRFLISAGDYDNQEIADILRENLPLKITKTVPVGNPGSRIKGSHYTTNSSKGVKMLGVSYRALETCVLDLAKQLVAIDSLV